ncbi:hypothetical protein K431DRAFT_287561 [Polychaeton citri CBS 116435]|uniref:CENP-V/GFA domain-containing protein n=1 Tax=Polychaeton citri CBS 116435 TaxID=1314669 RepID=A0A9P4Q5S5_9PEZI|nr:hypothetical protein K431DRAFT_287561 [Polychaeton citri CBS 116435]
MSEAVQVTRNDGTLVRYCTPSLEQEFCRVCGTGVWGTHLNGPLSSKKSLNLRTIRDVNPFDFEKRTEPPQQHSDKVLGSPATGSCHCGKVSVSLLIPLEQLDVKEDNCSICTRNAWIGVYPSKSQVVINGEEHMQEYRFGRKFNGNPFCRFCGVHVYLNLYGPPQEVVDRLSIEKQEYIRRMLDVKPVNIRTLDTIDVEDLDVVRSNEGTEGYEATVLGIAVGSK